ncbi:TPA: hypothetical protein QB260_001816, partial [Pasteurella multocida]|nr:hypothetical protein [Pasteurella multocida]
ILSIIFSIISTIIFNSYQRKKEAKEVLDKELSELLKLALVYPYLENPHFTHSWSSKYDRNDEKALRYEVYGNLVFNYLAKFADFYRYDISKMEKHLAVKDWIRLHSKYWQDPTIPNENIDTYDSKFVDLVDKHLRGYKYEA